MSGVASLVFRYIFVGEELDMDVFVGIRVLIQYP